ncbi:MAG: peptidase M22 [Ruminococcus sp.]|nr:peptidase M22 [Ruminococcus sp.]
MAKVLGIDTSNYTTSATLLDTDDMSVKQSKILLPVKQGEKGVRQSEAVFHHTKQLPLIMERLMAQGRFVPDHIGVSVKPRLEEGSYMPCFLVGEGFADSLGAVVGVTPDKTSHQIGHILAAIYSSQRFDLIWDKKPFAAFHVSGGTTDLLYCEPDDESILKINRIGGSDDLKAGQAIDRCGVMLGLSFPCGQELERLAVKSDKSYKIKPSVKGLGCSLSGLENKCKDMLSKGCAKEDIAGFCIDYVLESIKSLTEAFYKEYGEKTVIYAGGVMSNSMIRSSLESAERVFCEGEFSRDNACGVAVYSAIKRGLIG